MTLKIAIVGSGPSGFYTANALLKACEDCRIDILDRLPTPFGLIRGGVAPDHAKTKNVTRAYTKTAEHPSVRYFGNVEMGRDVSVAELKDMYDAVVLTIGSPLDRPLGIPGDDKQGVIGAAAFVGWYNAHPDFTDLAPKLDTKAVAVVGNGNVAIDIARVLVKTPAEMAATDIAAYAARAIHASPLAHVYMFGRRGPVEAKFTNVELREMGELEDCAPVVDANQLPDTVEGDFSDRDRRLKERNLETLRSFVPMKDLAKSKRVHFAFFANPVEVLGAERVEGLRLERTQVQGGRAVGTGETFDIACGLVLPAIGYRAEPMDGLPIDVKAGIVTNADGHVEDNLYAAGWIKRGPTGTIGTNKHDGDSAATRILAEITPSGRPGRDALEPLLAERGVRAINFDDWKKIDAAEVAAAEAGAPRAKFATIPEMLACLD
ncbi:MAG: FAD-dependent oxidoreductase [Alphaproteobacteria bacterium]|nr:FAD-dependent oxidoreductase [Alphaproteobacteria bacterium]